MSENRLNDRDSQFYGKLIRRTLNNETSEWFDPLDVAWKIGEELNRRDNRIAGCEGIGNDELESIAKGLGFKQLDGEDVAILLSEAGMVYGEEEA